jgi:hypothetical protein
VYKIPAPAAKQPVCGMPDSQWKDRPFSMSIRLLLARVTVGARLFLLVAVGLAAVGTGGHFLGWPLLTSTLGPTGYVFAAHPDSETARMRNAITGHAAAVASGLFAVAVFGLWGYPSVARQGHSALPQVGAAAVAAGLTVLLLTVLRAHHAPAAATTLLIATGLAKPGIPLYGLLTGLAGIIILGPLLGRLPVARERTAADSQSASPSARPGPRGGGDRRIS